MIPSPNAVTSALDASVEVLGWKSAARHLHAGPGTLGTSWTPDNSDIITVILYVLGMGHTGCCWGCRAHPRL